MNILDSVLMQVMKSIQHSIPVPAFAGNAILITDYSSHSCRSACSGSCDGECYGSCDDSCSGSCDTNCSGDCSGGCENGFY